MFKFGISSWCYPWSMGVARGPQPPRKMTATELVDRAVSYNVGLVQVADNCPLDQLPDEEIRQLAKYSRDHDVSLEVGTRGSEPDRLRRYLEIASILDSPILRVLPAFFGDSAVMEEVEGHLRLVLPLFEKAGITIVLENTEAFKAEDYAGLVERINHPNFKMCIDLANALGAMEGPVYFLERLIRHCGNLHFKDVTVTRSETVMGFSIKGVPAGQGGLSLPWILSNLNKHHLDPSVIIELWPPFTGDIGQTMKLEDRWVKQSVEYVRTVV